MVHRDFTRDGKARLHRFVKDHAIRKDVVSLVDILMGFRRYLGLKDESTIPPPVLPQGTA
jgi:hypothetical protein